MTRVRRATGRTFESLHVRNFRLYFFGQVVSASGSWMQYFAQLWLVLRLTGSGIALGVTLALQFAPTLVAGAWGGLIADRLDKRKVLVVTSAAATVLAFALGTIVWLGAVELWMVYALAFAMGCVTALDNPARRAFVVEMVGPEQVANATALTSAVFTASRVVGPALAGLLIAGVGIAWCFFANAVSYGAVIAALLMMRRAELHAVEPAPRAKGQLRDGLRYTWRTPELRVPLAMVAVIGTLSFNFQLVLSLMTTQVFHVGSRQLGITMALMSVGSVLGALTAAHHARPTHHLLVVSAFAFGALMTVASLSPTLPVLMLLLVPTGFAGMAFLSMANSSLQLRAAPQMRGRVGALFGVAFLGTTPIGAPIVGWVAEQFGPRSGLVVGGVAALVTAAVAARSRVPVHEATPSETVPGLADAVA
ncbi:MAG: MFS transporter [Acidimicrobiia bacterium]